ncbi:MAG: trigger factor [Clostridiales bacterium]|nr:trigger factor [Clostridiales bacterium]MDY2920938.1 trigger factor [Lentihominibacter sp.]
MKMKKIFKTAGILAMAIAGIMVLSGCDGDMPYGNLDPGDYLKVGDYKGLETEKIKVEVTQQDIGDEISSALEAATEDKDLEKGDKVAEGDTVNINYVGKIDGKKFDGGSAEKQDLTLGSGSFIDGFEEGLEGKKVGQKGIKLELTFPDDYSSEDLQGKDVVFTVKINSATRPEEPEYDDEFAQSQGYDTTDKYEKAVKKKIRAEKKSEAESAAKEELWSDVLENTKVKEYPEDELNHYIEVFNAQVDQYGEKGTDERSEALTMFGVSTEKELKKMIKESAQLLVKQELLIEYIADKEELTYTDEELDNMISGLETQGYDDEAVEEQTGRNLEQYVHISLLYSKVQDFIYDNAEVVE